MYIVFIFENNSDTYQHRPEGKSAIIADSSGIKIFNDFKEAEKEGLKFGNYKVVQFDEIIS